LQEVNKYAADNVNIDAPIVHILSGLNENNGLQLSPARFSNVKESDLPCLKIFVPVHQKIEDYPGDVENLDFDHLRVWIGVITVKSDIEAIQGQLKNVTQEIEPEEKKKLESNLEYLQKAHDQL